MITSLDNKKIKDAAKLLKKKYRDKEKKFLVEGFHLYEEAKKLGLIDEVFTTMKNIDGTLVSPEVIKKISDTKTPQPIVAIVNKPKSLSLGNKVLVLDNVQDPGNVGTLIRTARAFNYDSVIVRGADIYSPKVIRSTQGTIFSIPIFQTHDISDFFEGYEKIGAILDKSSSKYNEIKPSKKFMLILGNEGNGIEKEIIKKLDKKVYIPIDFESLNVASAGAILLNEYKNY